MQMMGTWFERRADFSVDDQYVTCVIVFQRHNANGDLEIYAQDREPKSGSFGTMALTLPFLVARVERPERAVQKNEFPVVWMEREPSKDKKKKQ